MASGNPVVLVQAVLPPQTLFAVMARRAGSSAPAEGANVWEFDAAISWYLDFLCALRGYDGGGLTFTIPWMAATATSNVTHWEIGIRRMAAGTDDLDAVSAHVYDYNGLDATAPATSGMVLYSEISFTHGADMDNWANGELAIVRVRRDPLHANDNMAGFAQLWESILGRET